MFVSFFCIEVECKQRFRPEKLRFFFFKSSQDKEFVKLQLLYTLRHGKHRGFAKHDDITPHFAPTHASTFFYFQARFLTFLLIHSYLDCDQLPLSGPPYLSEQFGAFSCEQRCPVKCCFVGRLKEICSYSCMLLETQICLQCL